MKRRRVKVHRMTFSTDYDPGVDPEYQGNWSEPFMVGEEDEIVNVDWSVPGEVEVTYLSTSRPEFPTPGG